MNQTTRHFHDRCQNEKAAASDEIQSDRPEPNSCCCFAGALIPSVVCTSAHDQHNMRKIPAQAAACSEMLRRTFS